MTMVQTAAVPAPRDMRLATFGGPWLWLAIGVVASLLAVGGPRDVSLAAWIAPIFLLRFVRTSRLWVGLPVVWLVSIADACCWWAQVGPPQKHLVEAVELIAFGTIYALPYIVDRLIAPRVGILGKALTLPAAWACAEYVFATLGPLGALYGVRAITQTDNLALLQLCSVLGPYSIGFLIYGVAAVGNLVWDEPANPSALRAAIAAVVVLGLVLIGGALRLAFAPLPQAYVPAATVSPSMYAQTAARAVIEGRAPRLGVAASDLRTIFAPTALFASREEKTRTPVDVAHKAYAIVQDDLLASTRAAARSGAKIVLWSETAAPVLNDADKPAFVAKIGDVAREEKIYIVAAIGEAFARNQTIMVGPDGRQQWSYDKNHPVPIMEPVPPRANPLPSLATPFGLLSNMICFDADFPALARVRADLMLVPGFDWPELGRTHSLKMVSVRTIENGYSMLRSSAWGQSVALDRFGRILATQDTTGPEAHIMYADLPTKGAPTLYNRTGDLLIWISLAGLLAAIYAAIFGRRRAA
ncbi:apolipoprotein N-acyltransferase [Sphingomonas oligophenolica]|uniref:Nitrilase-related carbon-nitrogen hydrolase n=1 Tax=Sphingomonas oligophenolica TaxID=301154 RepID=A0ABU9Y648_9SPHN